MFKLTRSNSSKIPSKILCSTIIPNTTTTQITNKRSPSNEIIFSHNPSTKRDMRNEVPIKTLVYKNENLTTIAKNFNKNIKKDEEDNFAAHFFTNSLKRYDRDLNKEVREKLIDEYKKENPDSFVIIS